MDELGGVLDGPRARGAFALKAVLGAPWSVAIRDEAPLTAVVLTRGEAHLAPEAGAPAVLRPGDVALLRGPAPYVVAHEPGAEPDVIVLPGQVCVSPAGESLSEQMMLGVNTWGNRADGETTMLIGAYQGDGELGRRLLDALPPMLVLRHGEWEAPVVDLLAAEIAERRPGQSVVLDRLLDLLVVAVVRAWAGDPQGAAPGWLAVDDDPCVATALELMHERCAEPWTVAALAREVGLSRAAFARRFQDVVGQPPIGYLTQWRLALAADLLRQPEATVTAVARHVGYDSPFTFSAAFKRHYGRSPRHYAIA